VVGYDRCIGLGEGQTAVARMTAGFAMHSAGP
jgi:hypothetical protein